MDFIGWDEVHFHEAPQLLHIFIIFPDQFIWRHIPQAFSPGTIDMIHQQGYIFLCVWIKTPAFRNYIPDILMILFDMWFLPGSWLNDSNPIPLSR